MLVNGSGCSIVIKTAHAEMDIPYSAETLREAVSCLYEEAAIEGDGICRVLPKPAGITGCVVTPLTIGTVPLLMCLAMGVSGSPLYVSETRDLYQYRLNLLPMEEAEQFDLIQERGGVRRFFEGCCVLGFELRIMRGETVKLKLDISGERAPVLCPSGETVERENGERFNGDFVSCCINGAECTNIYGITLASNKKGGTRTEVWVKRALQTSGDFPRLVEEMTVTARLLRDKHENRYFGMFRITFKRLVMTGDETEINASGAVISPLRFYVSGGVSAEVFASGGEALP